ncbi:MAG TPA: fumarylacetoacetate hydrolase family protein [Casimicrobiaceae bacterium]|nr:fumarylacetoacetate hydrolase family protein [Casimicrobiaceae bacterium]
MTWIALASYRLEGRTAPAVVHDRRLYDLADLARSGIPAPDPRWLERGVSAMIADWDRCAGWLRDATPRITDAIARGAVQVLPDDRARLAAPLVPERIFCAASNYVEHANEMGTVLAAKTDSKPYMFLKLRNTVIGTGDTIRMPPETAQLDWEIELAAVIGKRCRRIGVEAALDAVAGYTICNDISARDLNVRSDYPFKFDWFQGKCHDTFAPLGPWIVPAWQVPDPQAVHLHLEVNGKSMQDDTTANMIWTVREQIAYLSTIVTLEPGDVVATGTPTGVGMGRGVFLKDGDRIEATIDGIGTLANQVKADVIR